MTNSDQRIHFIVGIWRSGTTLMKEVLGMEPKAKVFPEHMITLNNLHLANDFSRSKKIILSNILKNPDFTHFAQPDSDLLSNTFIGSNSFRNGILASFNACLKANESIETFIDKNPIYSYFLPEILNLFPKSKIVWMLREPKDNCISRKKYNIQSFKNYSYLAHWWNETNLQIAKQVQLNPERFLLVSYDAMVKEPEEWVRKICRFLDLPFNKEMLSFESKKDERVEHFKKSVKSRDGKIDKNYSQQKAAMWENLQKPINTSKLKQWEKELTEKEIKAIDFYTKDFYEALLSGNYSFRPKANLVYKALMNFSLYKLKRDIRLLKKV